jgi:hypothetical protein
LPTVFEARFVENRQAWAHTAPQQGLIVYSAVGGGTKYADGFQQVALAATVGTNEHIDPAKLYLDFFKRLESFDFDLIQHVFVCLLKLVPGL